MQNQKLYVIQDYYDYNNVSDAFPLAIYSTLGKAKTHVNKRVQEALTEFKAEGYSIQHLSTQEITDTDATYEIGIYDDEEGLLERISVYGLYLE